jgi:hypothetical protein
MKDTPIPREEFEEWLETFYENSNILSPRSLAWEAWQAAQKGLTEQRDRLAEALERILDYKGRFAEEEPESIAREALKSLITNK